MPTDDELPPPELHGDAHHPGAEARHKVNEERHVDSAGRLKAHDEAIKEQSDDIGIHDDEIHELRESIVEFTKQLALKEKTLNRVKKNQKTTWGVIVALLIGGYFIWDSRADQNDLEKAVDSIESNRADIDVNQDVNRRALCLILGFVRANPQEPDPDATPQELARRQAGSVLVADILTSLGCLPPDPSRPTEPAPTQPETGTR